MDSLLKVLTTAATMLSLGVIWTGEIFLCPFGRQFLTFLDAHSTPPYSTTIHRSQPRSCGGAIDPTTNGYTYYMTAEPPYFPSCFRSQPGSLVERPYVASDYTTVSSCPKAGYNLTFVNPTVTLNPPPLTPPVCNEPYDGPYFLFRLDIDFSEPWWGISSRVFGAIFLFLFVYTSFLSFPSLPFPSVPLSFLQGARIRFHS